MEYEFHPIANKYPLMDDDQFKRLVADMEKHGYDRAKPIWIIKDTNIILDGRNRYNAAKWLGIEFFVRPWKGECGTEEEFVRQQNFHRCHYSKDQLAVIAAEEHEATKNKSGRAGTGQSAKDVASNHNVSETRVHTAKRVMKGGRVSCRGWRGAGRRLRGSRPRRRGG